MSIEIKVPPLPESVSDATLVAWHKSAGETVSRDENLVDLETDKVVLEVPAPVSGTIVKIVVKNGTTVAAGDVLAIIEAGESVEALKVLEKATSSAAASIETVVEGTIKTSPAVRRLLEEYDLDATMVGGTGKEGRITKSDVMSFLKTDESSNVAPGDPTSASEDDGAIISLLRTEKRVPMTRLRARIAERLIDAQQSAAMLTTFNEVDMTEVMALRKRYRNSFEKKHDVRLGFMSFFAKASVEALKQFPVINASVEGNEIIYHNYFDIGVAVSSDRGLMVPVIRDVDQLSFAEFEHALNSVAAKAQAGTIGMEDLTGGTFTITNGGIFGSMMSTPILNQPQSAILGMHSIQERAMVIDGEILARPMMYLAVTYDHRIIDGKEAVQFLVSIKEQLEDPVRLLLQV